LSRIFDICLGAFVAALLLYVAVQLVAAIRWWLLGGALVVIAIGGIVTFVRVRGERWPSVVTLFRSLLRNRQSACC
jgi:hypothetical protein